MAITKERVVNRIIIGEDGVMGVRYATYYVEDGKRSAPQYQLEVITPINDPKDLDDRVQRVKEAVHTIDVVEAYREKHVKPVEPIRDPV